MNTGIIIATKLEATPFIEGLNLPLIEKKPIPVYRNSMFVLAISGIGKANAAIATALLIERYTPSILFNLGAAGAANKLLNIGDIRHIRAVIEPDRPQLPKNKPFTHNPDVLQGFPTATLATNDRPIVKQDERLTVSRYADLVDMEGASVVQACRMYSTRVYLFKIVTDTEECSTKKIIKNITGTRDSLFYFFQDKISSSIVY